MIVDSYACVLYDHFWNDLAKMTLSYYDTCILLSN